MMSKLKLTIKLGWEDTQIEVNLKKNLCRQERTPKVANKGPCVFLQKEQDPDPDTPFFPSLQLRTGTKPS